jgi:hypothetical protein
VRGGGPAPDRRRVQVHGGAVYMLKGELVFDGVAISDTSALVRRPLDARVGRPFGRRAAAGLRRTGSVCRNEVAQFGWPMAPSRSAGTAPSRACRRCARPDAITRARTCSKYWCAVLALVQVMILGVVSRTYARGRMRTAAHTRAYEQE